MSFHWLGPGCVVRLTLMLLFLTELDELMKRSSDPDFAGFANLRLVSTLMENLSDMEVFSQRDAVSQTPLTDHWTVWTVWRRPPTLTALHPIMSISAEPVSSLVPLRSWSLWSR